MGVSHYYTVYKYLLPQGFREKIPELTDQLEEQKNYAELRTPKIGVREDSVCQGKTLQEKHHEHGILDTAPDADKKTSL